MQRHAVYLALSFRGHGETFPHIREALYKAFSLEIQALLWYNEPDSAVNGFTWNSRVFRMAKRFPERA